MRLPTTSRLAQAAAAALLAGSIPVAAAGTIVPALPNAFQPVNLRIEVDSCTFEPSSVRVTSESNTLRVTQRPNACLLPGPPKLVDIGLGSLAAGDYRVEVYGGPGTEGEPIERLAFQVLAPAEIAIYPPPPRPLTDYSGIWYNAAEPGWGLSVHQSSTHGIFAALYVYDEERRARWFVVPGGTWTDSTTWTGTVYRATGPVLGDVPFDPGQVRADPVGSATLEFASLPAEGRARLTYSIDGRTTTRPIVRQPF